MSKWIEIIMTLLITIGAIYLTVQMGYFTGWVKYTEITFGTIAVLRTIVLIFKKEGK